MELWIATGNKGKLSEYQLLLKNSGLDIHSQSEISSFSARPEDGQTFYDNAKIKARSLKAVRPDTWIFGEDSGLEVEGLNNLPGIHSARYAGPKASDSENVAKLLKMMSLRAVPNRNARFACCLVVYTPTGEEWVFTTYMKGTIAAKPAGLHGFGYDPVFIPEGESKTLAELGSGYKTTHSHRAFAVKEFLVKKDSAQQ
ncbi:MAG: RdgB/HAM1 family non-canonical purine NTP pyrophosphatase [Pseudobdellovibrionaceae bacterium]